MQFIATLALLAVVCYAGGNDEELNEFDDGFNGENYGGHDDIVCGNRRTGFVRVFLNRDDCPRPYYRIELPEGEIGRNGPAGPK